VNANKRRNGNTQRRQGMIPTSPLNASEARPGDHCNSDDQRGRGRDSHFNGRSEINVMGIKLVDRSLLCEQKN
jgi:hypothetical protein